MSHSHIEQIEEGFRKAAVGEGDVRMDLTTFAAFENHQWLSPVREEYGSRDFRIANRACGTLVDDLMKINQEFFEKHSASARM